MTISLGCGRNYNSPEDLVARRILEIEKQKVKARIAAENETTSDRYQKIFHCEPDKMLFRFEKPTEKFISPWMKERIADRDARKSK